MNRKIFIITNNSEIGGLNNALCRLLSAQNTNDKRYVVFPENGNVIDNFKRLNVNIIIFNKDFGQFGHSTALSYNIIRIPHLLRDIFRTIVAVVNFLIFFKKYKPDLIHLNSSVLLAPSIAAKILKIDVVWHIREHILTDCIGKLYVGILEHLSQKIIVINKTTGKLFKEKKKIVLFDFVDLEYLNELEYNTIENTKFSNKTIVTFLGGCSYLKGILDFLKIVKIFKEREWLNKFKFLLLGDMKHISTNITFSSLFHLKQSKYFKQVDELLRLLENDIKILGLQKDVMKYINVSDIILVLHKKQHSAQVAIEAGMLSKPIIAYNWPEIAEIIQDNVSGILIDNHIPLLLADFLFKLGNDPDKIKYYGENAYNIVNNNFSLNKVKNIVNNLYNI